MVNSNGLDKRIVDLLLENYENVAAHVKEKQAIAKAEYQKCV